uniref:Fibronectin type-III domain-containing protein n=1 Tax=Glossina palpalis gambiensis TaxID=67801 RepID=A0A1B0AL65_9MUSC
PTGKPVPTSAHNTSSTSVYIAWKPPPPDTILGEFLGYRITYRPRDRNPNDTKEIYIRDSTVEVSNTQSMIFPIIRSLLLHFINAMISATQGSQSF